ncbi:PLC-like phosphodiesterase [Coprinopsis marcescibilis]|uniref:PLC-like phosphodiesterase n=1 Tax=Coprinopsis marcescibilis TaxID=230819 RepID=A0A5C3KHC2_COPMA|nr:PLC-like phosphodiesterase [Coprinopsis marcescibilis]
MFFLFLLASSTYLFLSATSTFASWQQGGFPATHSDRRDPGMQATLTGLQDAALQEILRRGAPILGTNDHCPTSSPTCDWMARFPDDTRLVHMNLPGTHDAATGSYSDAVRAGLLRYTGEIPPSRAYKCQERTLLQMLNDGIRVFDMRYAYNPGNDTIGFWHSRALLAPTTTLSDVLYGFYAWLDQHPTETVLMSFNHEGGTGTPRDEKIERMIFETFSKASSEDPNHFLKTKYWSQTRGELTMLGESRGKLVFLQRFLYEYLKPVPSDDRLVGIQLGPNRWTDNGQNIELVYNDATGATAYIQDYYGVTPADGTVTHNSLISTKFDVLTTHLERAINTHPDQLFINFASAAYIRNSAGEIVIDPKTYALGNEPNVPGINQRLLPWLRERKGRRLGIIMFDFYDAVPGLIEAAIGI